MSQRSPNGSLKGSFLESLPDTIPFDENSTQKNISWIVAFILYLAFVATFSAIALYSGLEYLSPGRTQQLTLEVQPPEKPEGFAGSQEDFTEQFLAQVVDVVSEHPGVVSYAMLSESEMERLLSPWFGHDFNVYDLSLPVMMDIKVDLKNPKFDDQKLLTDIHRLDPSALFVEPISWLAVLENMAFRAEFLLGGLVLLILGVAAAIVTFTTRTNLLMQKDVIELLTLLGATDRFIAQRFERTTMMVALEALAKAMVGLLLTGAAMWWVLMDLNDQQIWVVLWHLFTWKIIFLFLVPAAIIWLMVYSARRCVFKNLEKLF